MDITPTANIEVADVLRMQIKSLRARIEVATREYRAWEAIQLREQVIGLIGEVEWLSWRDCPVLDVSKSDPHTIMGVGISFYFSPAEVAIPDWIRPPARILLSLWSGADWVEMSLKFHDEYGIVYGNPSRQIPGQIPIYEVRIVQ